MNKDKNALYIITFRNFGTVLNDAITSSASFSNVKNFYPVELRLKSEQLAFQDGFQWNNDVRSVMLMINKSNKEKNFTHDF